MKKIAAFGVFLILAISDGLGVELGLLPGLSLKNAMLYILVIWITFEAVTDGRDGGFFGRKHDYLALHTAFIFLIFMAVVSSLVSIYIIKYPGFSVMRSIMSIKAYAVDHYLMIFVFLAALRDSREALWMAKAMLITMAFVNLVSLIDMFGMLDLDIMRPRSDGRLQGPLGNSGEIGPLMAFYIPLILSFIYLSRGWARTFWIIAALLYVIVMLFTAARSPIVGLVGGGIIGAFFLRRYFSVRQIAKTVAVLASIGAVAVAFLAIEYGDLLYGRFIEENVSGSLWDKTSGRTAIWGAALSQMWNSPWTLLVGFGWKTFSLINPLSPHSEYLTYFFSLGLIGLSVMVFAYFSVVNYVLIALKSASRQKRILLIGFVFGYLSILVSIFFGNLHNPWLFIWALVGTMLRFARGEEPSLLSRDAKFRPPVRIHNATESKLPRS